MGGNRYPLRKDLSELEKDALIKRYIQNADKLKSLFDENKTYKTVSSWVDSFARNGISDSSKNEILFRIIELENEIGFCQFCSAKMTFHEFIPTNFKKRRCFPKYCKKCASEYIFASKIMLDKSSLIKRGKNISNAKKAFFTTEKGKETASRVGKFNSDNLRGKTLSHERRDKQSMTMRNKIATGSFTPPINNSWTHWEAKYISNDGLELKFRSSWELCFYFCNQHLQYETFRIPYFDGVKNRTYIADFFDSDRKTVYEIKPSGFFKKQHVKISAAIDFCKNNNINYVRVDENNIITFLDIEKILSSNNIAVLKNWNKVKRAINYGNAES